MDQPKYLKFDEINIDELVVLLNKPVIRKHLIEHEVFDTVSAKLWIEEKIKVNEVTGCRVRGVYINTDLVGWCGIQLEKGNYELAIVIDEKVWGLGKTIFKDIMKWAKEMGHTEVFIHFLHTRPEYKFLSKVAKNVFITELYGNKFTTYQLSVNKGLTRR